MPLCVLTVYLMVKKDILGLDKLTDKENKYAKSQKLLSLDFDSWH